MVGVSAIAKPAVARAFAAAATFYAYGFRRAG
jgi:hypothetical protein